MTEHGDVPKIIIADIAFGYIVESLRFAIASQSLAVRNVLQLPAILTLNVVSYDNTCSVHLIERIHKLLFYLSISACIIGRGYYVLPSPKWQSLESRLWWVGIELSRFYCTRTIHSNWWSQQ